jgi:hypothetical protein
MMHLSNRATDRPKDLSKKHKPTSRIRFEKLIAPQVDKKFPRLYIKPILITVYLLQVRWTMPAMSHPNALWCLLILFSRLHRHLVFKFSFRFPHQTPEWIYLFSHSVHMLAHSSPSNWSRVQIVKFFILKFFYLLLPSSFLSRNTRIFLRRIFHPPPQQRPTCILFLV